MSTRVSPVERMRADIEDLFASERDLGDVLEEVARLGVRLLMQTAIEAEVTEFLAGSATPTAIVPELAVATATAPPPSRPPPGQ